mmetsp:Transcript_43483/g.97520  ORF Transcript_43483/g.97520 Transcript_43483/m.97520 type:complete len:220 (-) Transcript_43483:761-1420(-)
MFCDANSRCVVSEDTTRLYRHGAGSHFRTATGSGRSPKAQDQHVELRGCTYTDEPLTLINNKKKFVRYNSKHAGHVLHVARGVEPTRSHAAGSSAWSSAGCPDCSSIVCSHCSPRDAIHRSNYPGQTRLPTPVCERHGVRSIPCAPSGCPSSCPSSCISTSAWWSTGTCSSSCSTNNSASHSNSLSDGLATRYDAWEPRCADAMGCNTLCAILPHARQF